MPPGIPQSDAESPDKLQEITIIRHCIVNKKQVAIGDTLKLDKPTAAGLVTGDRARYGKLTSAAISEIVSGREVYKARKTAKKDEKKD